MRLQGWQVHKKGRGRRWEKDKKRLPHDSKLSQPLFSAEVNLFPLKTFPIIDYKDYNFIMKIGQNMLTYRKITVNYEETDNR
jgi:hypothetical protein